MGTSKALARPQNDMFTASSGSGITTAEAWSGCELGMDFTPESVMYNDGSIHFPVDPFFFPGATTLDSLLCTDPAISSNSVSGSMGPPTPTSVPQDADLEDILGGFGSQYQMDSDVGMNRSLNRYSGSANHGRIGGNGVPAAQIGGNGMNYMQQRVDNLANELEGEIFPERRAPRSDLRGQYEMTVPVGQFQNQNQQIVEAKPDPDREFEPVGQQDPQLHIVQLLLHFAEAVSQDNLQMAGLFFSRLNHLVLNTGSPMQRLASYISEALVARITKQNKTGNFKGLVANRLQNVDKLMRTDLLEAFSVFYESIPIGKFAHLTMNQIILDAIERDKFIHVIDFQVWYGAQWPSFLQALSLRPGGPPEVRMTAIGSSKRDLEEAGAKLSDYARTLQVPFKYIPLAIELELFNVRMLDRRENEVIIVNSLSQFHCFINNTEAGIDRLLNGLRGLNPKVVVMAENDVDHNSVDFLTRFVECLRYYSAVFDAIDASLPPTSHGRQKLEQLIAAQKIRNIIACEGDARVERHESMNWWRQRMEMNGFRAMALSSRAVSQANLLLNLYYSEGYTLANERGFLILGWRGMPLNGVSAWI